MRSRSGSGATLALALLLLGAGAAWAADATDIEAATYLYQRERYTEALPLAQRAVGAAPQSVPAHDLLGQVLTRLDRPAEAIAELDQAAAADPKNVNVLVHLGEAQMTQYSQGIAAWRKVHGDSPLLGTMTSDIPGAMAGGSARYSPDGGPVLGETDKVSELTRNPNEARNPRFDPGHSAMGMLRRSTAMMNQKERENHEMPARAALATFEKALAIEPESAGALRGRAFALYAVGEYADAGVAFEKAGKVAHTDDYLYEMAADAYGRVDQPNDAIRAWESVLAINPLRLEAYKNLQALYGTFRHSRWERGYYSAMERLLSGKADDALDDLITITDRHPDFAPGWRAVGSAYLLLKDNPKAIKNLSRALELDPQNGLTEYELGVAYLRGGETPSAHQHITRAAALRPDYAPAWFSLGVVAEKEKDPDSAIAAYQRALELRPNWAEAHYNLGALLLDRRQGTEAVEHLERYVALRPDAPDAGQVRQAVEQVKAIEKKG